MILPHVFLDPRLWKVTLQGSSGNVSVGNELARWGVSEMPQIKQAGKRKKKKKSTTEGQRM